MDITEVLVRLENVEQLDLPAVRLILELSQTNPTEQTLAELQPEIEKAIAEIIEQSETAKEMIKRCERIQALPSSQSPIGF